MSFSRYIDNHNFKDLDEHVDFIYLCAHENQNTEDLNQPPSNHWTFSLQTDKNHSLEMGINPEAGADLRDGMIWVKPEKTISPDEPLRSVRIPVMNRPTARDLLHVFRRKGLDRFRFAEDMGGERYWCNKVVDQLEDTDFIPVTYKDIAQEALQKYYPEPKGAKPVSRPLDHGEFY